MLIDLRNFLLQLAPWMATAASLEYAGTPRQLWVWQADEKDAAPVYSVLTTYSGGNVAWVGDATIPVQCRTVGANAAAWTQAGALFNTLFDPTSELPRRNVTITGHKIIGIVNPRPPGLIGRDEQNRAEIVFNFDANAIKTA